MTTLADPEPEFGGHMMSVEHDPMMEMWGRAPNGVQGRASDHGVIRSKSQIKSLQATNAKCSPT